MSKRAAVKRRFAGLGFRLMAVMGVALLPLAILSYVQGVQTARLSEGRVTTAIKGETLVAASPLIAEIVKAQAKAATLAATLPSVIDLTDPADLPACRAVMDNLVASNIGRVVFAGFVPPDGQMVCGSGNAERDLSASPALAQMIAEPKPMMTVSEQGPVSGASVLVFSHPVFGPGGDLTGLIILSLPQQMLAREAARTEGEPQPLSLMTFDAAGTLLSSSIGMEAGQRSLPANRPLSEFSQSSGTSFVDLTQSGQRRAFAVVPLQAGALFLLGSWPATRLDDTILEGSFPAFLFPALMWAASLLVAWLAAESQVLRHVRALRDRITAFAAGARQVPPLPMEGAALELRSVGQAYERMTEAVLRNEADLENIIHQKEVLLREVHHRVKNNLQLIASILNMQLRGARTAEAKEAMRTVQDRVISLATVHRELYQTSGLTDVRADELLPRVARDLLHIGSAPGRQFELDARVDDIRLTPDQAVPLALFLTEGMANVIKHAWTGGAARSRVVLRLERAGGGMARFMLSNRIVQPGDDGQTWVQGSDGFGSQLLNAFAQQVNGTVHRGREEDGYALRLEFPLRPLSEGEERAAAQAPDRPSPDAGATAS
jgi:two-component sensor histidine kinase